MPKTLKLKRKTEKVDNIATHNRKHSSVKPQTTGMYNLGPGLRQAQK
jgi:hypothetical protein